MSPTSIQFNLDVNRKVGERTWDLPPWGHVLSMGVFPLFIGRDHSLALVGSAFCIGSTGLLASALHNVLEVYRIEGTPIPQLRGPLAHPSPSLNFKRSRLSVFHQEQRADTSITGSVWPLETVDAAPPTDLAFAFPQFQTQFPYLHLPITFDLPRVGSQVKCVGYATTTVGAASLDLDALETGRLDVAGGYSHSFRAVEGTVTDIFVRSFAAGYLEGPCFAIDAEVPHGLSGGPVFAESGLVCGVVSAGATEFFGSPSTLMSPFYPSLLAPVRFGASLGPVRMNATQRIIDLIGSGVLSTDGSEEHLAITELDGHPVVGPRIPHDDHAHVHDDFSGYQSGSGGTRVTGRVYRFRRTASSDDEPK